LAFPDTRATRDGVPIGSWASSFRQLTDAVRGRNGEPFLRPELFEREWRRDDDLKKPSRALNQSLDDLFDSNTAAARRSN
jgi:hypothetical protein